MTDTGYEGLRSRAQAYGCSISEYLERLGRGILGVGDEAYEVPSHSESAILGKEADFKKHCDTPNPALVL